MRPASLLSDVRPLLILALPLILAQLAQTSMGFVDALMVGGEVLGSTVFWRFQAWSWQ